MDSFQLYDTPNALAPHYARFRVAQRLLLTGHSHQAWPDVGFDAQQQAWLDAATFVDDKWEAAAMVAERVRAGWRRLLSEDEGDITLVQNTHEAVTRLLSALPLRRRPRLVTTDGEFHTIRRQLDRLGEEEPIEIVRVPARPAGTVAERVAASVDDRTACVLISSVYYETAEIVPSLGEVARACERHGAALLVDAYHQLNVVPFDVRAMGLQSAYVTGGGYKYCQLGEGNGFLRVPPGCALRPVLTGWFSEFSSLSQVPAAQGSSPAAPGFSPATAYGIGPDRFAGATYDPTSHYRAAAVFAFHERMGLTPAVLREVSRHQVGLLKAEFESIDVNEAVARVEPILDDHRAGFLAIRSPHAAALCQALRERGVASDCRRDVLRLGPAPYLSDDQLRDAIARLGEALRAR